jgi:uncharacterized protein YfaS (alpha-2-macroglobulin family)
VEIVLDKPEYKAGDEALALITFRSRSATPAVAGTRQGRGHRAAGQGRRLAEAGKTQRHPIPRADSVKDNFAPNLTFSVLYTKGGQYSFQNAGIKVVAPQIDVAISTDKALYQPGDTVTVDLTTQFAGKRCRRT